MWDSDDEYFGPETSTSSISRYTMATVFTDFFGLDSRYRLTEHQIQRAVTDYATTHNGIQDKKFVYDEALWKLFQLPADKPFKVSHIFRNLYPLCKKIRPCPICEKPSPFNSYLNRLCDDCSPSNHKPKELSIDSTDLVSKILADMTAPEEPTELTIDGVECCQNNGHYYAIVRCPICETKINEERRLGAFCDACSRSEDLVDANGNRVRFEPVSYYDMKDGFVVHNYENGEIIKRFYTGEYNCFFRGMPCVAEDTGSNQRIIVRFREKFHKKWENVRLPSVWKPTEQPTQTPTDSDWLDRAYPRWSAWS